MTTADEAQLRQLEQDMFSAIRTRDRQLLESILDERFELRVPGSPTADRAGFIGAILAIPGTILSVESDDLRVHVYGDVGVLTGRQHARVRLEDGTIVDDVGAFTDIALNGGWFSLTASPCQPPPDSSRARLGFTSAAAWGDG
ncbi:nuclear transport factor 2 family protein [Cystobacter fuscus]|uniref:nuclear transport factor 2 family protein n=1 Tax=Cystobacter fuscus TaxID=43 RepID=UPI0012FDEEF5|nr:nuclear transport factor 2 family protein [Cystobacter fuscus]